MPALPTVVTDYLTAIKDSLKQGSDLGSNVRGAALNYLRAQDMATVLDLLQDGLDQTSVLTATGGTARSVQDTGAFTAGQQVGNVVVFTGNITAALAGVEARVVDNDANELFFADGVLPATPVATDTYTIRGGLLDTQIDDLREGKGLADAPAGSVYGEYRTAVDALVLGIRQISGSAVSYRVMMVEDALAASTDTVVALDLRGGSLVLDELRGMKMTVTGLGTRSIVSNDTEGLVTLSAPLTSAPTGGESSTVFVPADDVGGHSAPKIRTHPGAQPGENAALADLIQQLEDAVDAYTLPT
jgi:hypothetical protein